MNDRNVAIEGGFELSIVDVGHGNAAVVREGDAVAVVDTAVGNALLLFLEQQKISEVDFVLLSHSDADHIGGLIGLLSSGVRIRKVLINSDASKESEVWRDLIFALDDAQRAGAIEFEVGAYEAVLEVPGFSDCSMQIIGPSRALVALGVGAKDFEGRLIGTNSISAVVRVLHGEVPVALLAGDLDEVGLKEIERAGVDARADVLVFPHHGGLPGAANVDDFVSRLIRLTSPKAVLFSNGRGKHDNPRSEVVSAVRRCSENVYFGCTQLSRGCSKADSPSSTHLSGKFSAGAAKKGCCAGTVSCSLKAGTVHIDVQEAHTDFVQAQLPGAICLGRGRAA